MRFDVIFDDYDDKRHAKTSTCTFEVIGPTLPGPNARLNSALIASVFSAMWEGRSIHVKGPVSQRLMTNLEEFQRAFHSWSPRLSVVDMTAEQEMTGVRTLPGDPAIAAFSGGVDACFTTWRHLKGKTVQRPKNVKGVMLVQGLDVVFDDMAGWKRTTENAKQLLEGLDLRFHRVRTDIRLRNLLPEWNWSFGTALAACLHLFSDEYSLGLIGSDEPYNKLIFPWGSNPVTNHLLSSRSFEIVYDGGGFTRTQKVEAIGDWPSVQNHLRVCWEGNQAGRNCSRCEKCIRTILNFRAAGLPRPTCFEEDVTDDQIRNIKLDNAVQRAYLEDIRNMARSRGIQASWLSALEQRLHRE